MTSSPGSGPPGPAAPYGGPPSYGPPDAPGYGPPPQPPYGTSYGDPHAGNPHGAHPYAGNPYAGNAYAGNPYAGSPYGGPPPGQPPPAPPGVVLVPGAPPMRAATPSQRSLGRLYDSLGYVVVIALGVFVMYLILRDATDTSYDYDYGYPTSSSSGLEFLWIYPVIAGVWLVIVGYESLMIGLTGATLGDRLAGVRFIRTKDGADPGLARGLGRAGFLGVSFVGCYGLAFLLMLFSMFFDGASGRYQSWPDKIFGLQAVSTRG
ncbi:RDD family protein [Jatrophihabitans sp. YIM 134969]